MPRRPIRSAVRLPHVALLVETSLGSGRDILRGIASHVRQHRNWSLYHEPRSLEDSAPDWLARWHGDGIIARIQTPELAAAVRRTGLPVVDVLGVLPDAGFPIVHVDDAAIATAAADHLYERGFRKFAFFGIRDENWSERRREALRSNLAQRGCPLAVYEATREELRRIAWENLEDTFARWISDLPKPVGVVVCSDQRGPDFLEACRRAGVAVPDEVAVVGVDNDEPLCEVCQPPLSSVWPDHVRVGTQAAELLDAMMRGEVPPPAPILVPPRSVVVRRSTDVLAIADRNVAKALRVIREHGCDDLSVDRIVRESGVSRSVLQRRFRSVLGSTIHAEILNCRVQHACHLLVESDLSLMEIAERAGFKHQEYMGAVFKSRLKLTPGQYRKGNR